jgi:molecular chaperone DnaK
VKRIINEPTAAALAYGFNKKKDEKIVVFDFGGGTFDISILEVGNDVIEVKATDGDSHLGGKDIDQKIIDWLAEEFKATSTIDVRKDPLAKQRLDEAAEKAKIELSTAMETEVNLPFITSGVNGPEHLVIKMSRAKLEELTQEFIDRAMEISKRAMEASPFGLAEINEVILVGGQTRMPALQKAVETYFGKKPNMTVNPDEVVAAGAAIQGGILQGDVHDILLLDVIPLSLGIETMGGVATHLIDKNTTIPASRSQIFSTAADNQTSVEVHVVQGERPLASQNKSLGRFMLDGIPPAPRGVPQVEVTFDVDANGILNVKAKDKTSGKEQSIRIEASSSLSKDDIERMKKEAELHADEDKKKQEEIEVKNMAESMIYTAEKSLRDQGDKVPADIKTDVEAKIAELKQVKDGTDLEATKKATEALSLSLQKIGEEMAKAQSTTEGAAAAPDETTPPSGDSDVPPEGKVHDI